MQRAPAPEISLTAIGSGRRVDRAWIAGRPLLLIFHDQEAEALVRGVQGALRARWPQVAHVVAGSVVNMAAIPFFVRGLATRVMEGAYRTGASLLPSGLDPADYVLILPDAQGALYRHFDVPGSGNPPVAVVIDADWRVAGRFSGPTLEQDVLRTLEALTGA